MEWADAGAWKCRGKKAWRTEEALQEGLLCGFLFLHNTSFLKQRFEHVLKEVARLVYLCIAGGSLKHDTKKIE